jgi:hypothetical protein
MFEDIAQMEKEIETFRKNVVASSELVEGIIQLTEATNQQKEAVAKATDSLGSEVESCVAQIKEDHATALRALNDENKSVISALQENLSAEQASRLAELDRLKNELQKMQASYVEKLNQTDHAIQEYQRNAEIQYSDFVRRLQTTNVDQIFREVQELKQSMKAKFLLLMGGIGLTLIATILNFVLK